MITHCDCTSRAPYAVGQVVHKFVQQSSSDDYFMAIIWDGVEARIQQYEATAYGPCVNCNSRATCTVDASPELMASYQAKLAEQHRIAFEHDLHYGRALPVKGIMYVVARGRKVPKGTRGICERTTEGRFGYRAMLSTVSGSVWVDTKNLVTA